MATRDFSIFEDSPWLAGGPGRLGAAAGVPTMMSFEEELLCHWLGATWATGWGAVVDLGSFVGGPVARIAEGARAHGRQLACHAFDRFAVSDAHKAQFLYSAGIAPFEGVETRALVERLLEPWQDNMTLHPGDLADARWDPSDAIEVLIVDATKSTEVTDTIARVFYPALRPGSVVVQRGFLHWREPWVTAQMQRLSDVLVPIGHATDDSVVFGCVTTPEPAAIEAARLVALDDAELMGDLLAAREVFARFGAEDRLVALLEAVEHSPGVRTAWQMQVAP